MEIIGKVYSLEQVLEDEETKEVPEFTGDNVVSMLFNDCQNYPLLTPEEERRLIKAAKNGCMESRDKFISSNERLVINTAKKYLDYGIPWEDLIGDGNEGLIKAYEKFQPKKGFKFSTYAIWWIRQAITRNIADFRRIIRIPVHMLDRGNMYKKMKKLYELDNGKLELKSFEDLEAFAHYVVTKSEENKLESAKNKAQKESEKSGKEVEVKYKKLGEREYKKAVEVHIKTIPDVLEYLWQEPISLDFQINDQSSLVDFIESGNNPSDRQFNHKKEALRKYMLQSLTEKERRILEYRFGFEDGWQRTLQEVGEKFSLTRERIRQIENKALSKLKKSRFKAEYETLKEYYLDE